VTVEALPGRSLPILIRYPTDVKGPIPVVIYSHGGGFDNNGQHLGRDWAGALNGHGYAVVHLAHSETDAAGFAAMCAFAGVPESECQTGTFEAPVVARPLDISAILDERAEIGAWFNQETGKQLDGTRIVVMGWSGGSIAPLSLLGGRRQVSPTSPVYTAADDRVRAAIALSPQGPGFSGAFDNGTDHTWRDITKPVLVATGVNDVKPDNPELLGSIRRQAWEKLPGGNGNQRLLYSLLPVGTGGHGTFNLDDINSTDMSVRRFSVALSSAARAFLDVEMKDSVRAAAYLASGDVDVLADAEQADWLLK